MAADRWQEPDSLAINQTSMHMKNCLVVLSILRAYRRMSLPQLVSSTNLSRSTVGSIVEDLIGAGLANNYQGSPARRPTGRPPALAEFRASAGYFVGIDLGRTHLTTALAELDMRRSTRRQVPFTVNDGPTVGLNTVATQLQTLLSDWAVSLDPEQIVGIAIGFPGPIDHRYNKFVLGAGNMPGWGDIRLDEELAQSLGLWDEQARYSKIPIFVDNDANLGALGISRHGWTKQEKREADLVYVKIGTGIGAGLIKHNVLDYGAHGISGEIGHITVVTDNRGPRCTCGKRGCLEAVAAGPAIIAAGMPSSYATADMETSLKIMATRAREGNKECCQAFNEAGKYIGITLASLVNIEDPSLIVLDGQVVQAAGELITRPIQEAMQEASFSPIARNCRIICAAANSDAVAWGGIASVAEHKLRLFVEHKLTVFLEEERKRQQDKAIAESTEAWLSDMSPLITGNRPFSVDLPSDLGNLGNSGLQDQSID